MTTRIHKSRIAWIVMRYPEHSKALADIFTLSELVETFFDSAPALNTIARAYCPDKEDIEQIDYKLLYRLWHKGDVTQNALAIITSWLAEFRM